jgi:hypothetical protein
MYQKLIIPFLIILTIQFTSCSPSVFEAGVTQKNKVKADGILEEWALPLNYGSEDGKYQYAITYDKYNLYISLMSNDQISQMGIIRNGIDFYIDPIGKKNKTIHIHYPEKTNDQFSISGFKNLENGSYSTIDETGLQLGTSIDERKNLGIELIIPLKLINESIQIKKNQNISIGIAMSNTRMGSSRNGSSNSQMGRSGMGGGRGRMSGGMGGGRGGMGGGRGGMSGGMGRESSGSNGSNNQEYNRQNINWSNFVLFSQKSKKI